MTVGDYSQNTHTHDFIFAFKSSSLQSSITVCAFVIHFGAIVIQRRTWYLRSCGLVVVSSSFRALGSWGLVKRDVMFMWCYMSSLDKLRTSRLDFLIQTFLRGRAAVEAVIFFLLCCLNVLRGQHKFLGETEEDTQQIACLIWCLLPLI